MKPSSRLFSASTQKSLYHFFCKILIISLFFQTIGITIPVKADFTPVDHYQNAGLTDPKITVDNSNLVFSHPSSITKTQSKVLNNKVELDPEVELSSYFPGQRVAYDKDGFMYSTFTADCDDQFPSFFGNVNREFCSSGNIINNTDIVVVKIDPTTKAAIYTTIIGGTHKDHATDISVDNDGNAYVLGSTNGLSANDFPTTPTAYKSDPTNSEGVLIKINPSGNQLVYSTYIYSAASQIELVGDGVAAIIGGSSYVYSKPYNVNNENHGGTDIFVQKIDTNISGVNSLLFAGSFGG